jgi:ketosteroid isomerase-like protein
VNATINDSGIVVAAGRAERAQAVDLVREFLAALAHHDLPLAGRSLGSGFRMQVSGGHVFRTLEEFVAWSAQRNGSVRKGVDSIEACEAPVGVAVYAYGTMSGHWRDGQPFEGVRYCDRFLVRDGHIHELQVWSDMGEFRPR